jgi:cysteine desulfurase / selenocysteine lyase
MDLENERVFSDLRKDFPMLKKQMHGKPLIYFDSASTSMKPWCVIESMTDFYTNSYGTVHRAVYELAEHSTEWYQKVRETVRKFLNAKNSCEIIYTRGTTESINLVANSFGKAFINPGDEVIVSEIEHHSNIVPWQILCQERGAVLKILPVNDQGELDLEQYKNLLSEKTKIVAVCHVANSIGTLNPVKKIGALAHECGAKILIDGAQSSPHLPIDVQDLDADFYVFSGHKTLGPTGIGILYGKEELLEKMPPYQGGGDMIKSVSFEKTVYNDLPLKFEAGTPMIAEVLGLGAAIEYLSTIGMKNVAKWEQTLLKYATNKFSSLEGLKIIGNAKEKGAIISFVVEGAHPLDIGTLMSLQGVAVRTGHHCAQPTMKRFGVRGTTRASFALYNTKQEIDHFAVIVEDVIKKLR